MMMKPFAGLALVAVTVLAGCADGLRPYSDNPNTYIAVANDRGIDAGPLENQRAAIVYDPDGCQNWIIDDGVEGYSSPRFDPATGMANVCNNHFPPGAVVGRYQSRKAGMSDWVPTRGNRIPQQHN